MKLCFRHIIQLALFLSAFFILTNQAFAQSDMMELMPGAEKLLYIKETGEHRLIGNIHIKYQANTIYCDSVSYFDKSTVIKAYGHVHFSKRDTLNLYCDSLHYNGTIRKAKLWGNVRIRDRDYKITTDSLDFDSKNEVAVYRHGGRVESSIKKELIISERGYFYPKSKNLAMAGNIVYTSDQARMNTDTMQYNYAKKKVSFFGPTHILKKDNTEIDCKKGWYNTATEESFIHQEASIKKEKQFIKADTLYSNPQKGISKAYGNIYFYDDQKGVFFTGNKMVSSEKEHKSYLTGKALLSYRLTKDTLHIHSDTLHIFTDSINQLTLVKGYKNTRFYSINTQGKCDSLVYHKKNGKLEMHTEPIIWSKNAELKGTFIHVFLKDSIIEHAEILDKATAITEVDSLKFYNQIGGKTMFAYFNSDNELRKVDVTGNAQTIYYPEETTNNDTVVEIQRKGMTRLYSSTIKVLLENGEFSKVTYADQADGIFYPLDKINVDEQFITGYSWNPILRPSSKKSLIPDIKKNEKLFQKVEKPKKKNNRRK